MTGKTHLIGGVLAGAAFAYGTGSLPVLAATVAGAAAGALLPDLDHTRSTVTRRAGLAGFVLSHLLRQRGVLHTPVFGLLFCCLCRALVHAAAPGFTLLENAWTGLCLGIASHLVLDPCTPKGIWLFWPLSHRRYHWLDLPTGGWLEKLLALVMLAGLGGFGYSFMQNVL